MIGMIAYIIFLPFVDDIC